MKLSKGTQFAFFALLFIGTVALVFGIYDLTVKGSAPGVFPFAIVMYLIAVLIYFLGRRTDIVPAVALLLLSTALASCATGTSLASEGEREQQNPANWPTNTYTGADGFDHTVASQTWK